MGGAQGHPLSPWRNRLVDSFVPFGFDWERVPLVEEGVRSDPHSPPGRLGGVCAGVYVCVGFMCDCMYLCLCPVMCLSAYVCVVVGVCPCMM